MDFGLLICFFLAIIPVFRSDDLKNNQLCIPDDYFIDYDYFNTYVDYKILIRFHVLGTAYECVFEGDIASIERYSVVTSGNKKLLDTDLLYMDNKMLLRVVDSMFELDVMYDVTFEGRFDLYHSLDGFSIRFYREQTTMKRTWYALFKLLPDMCGKAYICLNTPNLAANYKFRISHIDTHSVICTGDFVGISDNHLDVPEGLVQTLCETTEKVLPNEVFILISTFARQDLEKNMRIVAPFHVGHVFPVAAKWFGDLVLELMKPIDWTPTKLDWVLLPHEDYRKEYIVQNACFFSLTQASFPASLDLRQQIFTCIFKQQFKYSHRLNSLTYMWVIEGLIEYFSLKHQTKVGDGSIYNNYNIIDGPKAELDSLTKSKTGQRKKAGGIFQMLNAICPDMEEYYMKILTTPALTEKSLDEILATFKPLLRKLSFNSIEDFMEMINTWAQPNGFPMIIAEIRQEQLCVTQIDEGKDHFQSYILPLKTTYGRGAVDLSFIWTNPSTENCVPVRFPYIINYKLNVVARTKYNRENYVDWAALLKEDPEALIPFEKARLINDLSYFVRSGKESLSTLIPFLYILNRETSRQFWMIVRPTIEYLDLKLRNTQFYDEFALIMMGSLRRFYASTNTTHPDPTAIYLGCLYGLTECTKYAEMEVHGLVEYYAITPLEETICAGMRQMDQRTIQIIQKTIGLPDVRDAMFYLRMLTCVEDRAFQRKLLNSLFLLDEYPLPPNLRKDLVKMIIKSSKAGLDTVMTYIKDTPITVLEDIGVDNFLEVLNSIADYVRDTKYLPAVDQVLNFRQVITAGQMVRYNKISTKITANSNWLARHYELLKTHFGATHSMLLAVREEARKVF